MEQPQAEDGPKAWAREVSGRIGRNVREYRTERGLSAQKLSDATAALGFPIPRSTIANMEAGRKDAISVQEASVLAEALHVPLSALLYSPLHPAETVRPVPSRPVPSYFAFNLAGWKHPSEVVEGSRLAEALMAVHRLEQNRSILAMLGQDLKKELLGLRVMERGAFRMTPAGPERVPRDEAELERQRREIQFVRDRIAMSEKEDEENVSRLRELGIEPWPLQEHISPFTIPDHEGGESA